MLTAFPRTKRPFPFPSPSPSPSPSPFPASAPPKESSFWPSSTPPAFQKETPPPRGKDFPAESTAAPPEQRPDFGTLSPAQLAAAPSGEPATSTGPSAAALGEFFPKPLLAVDPKTDKITQKVEGVDLLKNIRPSGGAAIEIAAVGPEDNWLSVNPSYSPFRKAYMRHTNFALNTVAQWFEQGFRFGTTNIAVVPLSGDVVTAGVLEVRLPALAATGTWVPYVGLALVREWRLLIGDQLVQTTTRDWQYFQTTSRTPATKRAGLDAMVGAAPLDVSVEHVLYVPIPFFFSTGDATTPKLTLPVSSLSNAGSSKPTRMELIAEDVANLVNLTSPAPLPASLSDAALLLDYVYLSDAERSAFVAFGHRMLYGAVVAVEARAYGAQADGTIAPKAFAPVRLDGVNKNVTNLAVVACDEDAARRKTLFSYRAIGSIDLYLNGQQKRFQTRPGDYFSRVVPYAHGGTPDSDDRRTNVYRYSFTAPGTFRERDNAGHVNLAAFGNPTLRANGVSTPDPTVPMKIIVMCEYLNFLTTENGFARVETV